MFHGMFRTLSKVSYPTEGSHRLQILVELVVICNNHASLDCRDVVGHEEAKSPHVPESPDLSTLVLGPGGLTRVL